MYPASSTFQRYPNHPNSPASISYTRPLYLDDIQRSSITESIQDGQLYSTQDNYMDQQLNAYDPDSNLSDYNPYYKNLNNISSMQTGQSTYNATTSNSCQWISNPSTENQIVHSERSDEEVVTSMESASTPPSLDVYLPAAKYRKTCSHGQYKSAHDHTNYNRYRYASSMHRCQVDNIRQEDIPAPQSIGRDLSRRGYEAENGSVSPLISFNVRTHEQTAEANESRSSVTPLGLQNMTIAHQNMSPCSSRQLSIGDLPFAKAGSRKRAFCVDGDTLIPENAKHRMLQSISRDTTENHYSSEHQNYVSSGELRRRCGRKSMNYSSEQKRERNRAAVKKCRQRQALKYEYLQRKAESLEAENQNLSEMLSKNIELDQEKRQSLTRGIQMDILLKIKEIFTQSLPKDFVIDADSIWGLNSVLAVSMPSRCYYGLESIKDFWRTSLRMRNKGKIRSFWAWLFRLPPGDRFSEFTIEPFSPSSSLYFIYWKTKSVPSLSGSMVIMFGRSNRVTLHVECFGWLIWRYLLTNQPFPESSAS